MSEYDEVEKCCFDLTLFCQDAEEKIRKDDCRGCLYNKPPGKFILKDSGEREKFDSGMVRDQRTGKGRFDLISPIALRRLAVIYEKGAIKYESRN